MTATIDADGASDWLLAQLPAHMVESNDDFLRRFLRIFAETADGVRGHGDAIPYLLDVDLTPERMVRFVATWIGLDLDTRVAAGQVRRIVGHSGDIVGGRGTAAGLHVFLRLMTGGRVEIDDTGGVFAEGTSTPVDNHVWIRLDHSGPVTADHLIDLIDSEIPADCTFELWVAGALVFSDRAPGMDKAS